MTRRIWNLRYVAASRWLPLTTSCARPRQLLACVYSEGIDPRGGSLACRPLFLNPSEFRALWLKCGGSPARCYQARLRRKVRFRAIYRDFRTQSSAKSRPVMLRRAYDWCIDAAYKPYALWLMGLVSFLESSFFPVPPD